MLFVHGIILRRIGLVNDPESENRVVRRDVASESLNISSVRKAQRSSYAI